MDSTSPTSPRSNASAKTDRPMRLASSVLGERRHVCAFFNSREDEYRVTLPFIKDGFECGDKAFHIIDPTRRVDHLLRMASSGIDTASLQGSGQFELHDWADTFFRDGPFDPDRQLALLEDVLKSGRQQGFPISRYVAHAEWALEEGASIDLLLEFEAKVNQVWPRSTDVVICTYDLARFPSEPIQWSLLGAFFSRIHSSFSRTSFSKNSTSDERHGPDHFVRRSDMEVQTQKTAEEIKRLQRCINDLVSVLALPAMWLGYDSSQIASTLLDALVHILHLDFAYVRIKDSVEDSGTEWARSAGNHHIEPDEIGRVLDHSLKNDTLTENLVLPSPIGQGVVSLAVFRLGLRNELGRLAAASQRADFPTAIEQLLLQVAANQAAIGLQEARYRTQQSRTTEELEQRVVERTAELARMNKELQKEILERTRAEDRLQLLLDVTNQVVSNLQLRDLLQAISASVRRVMQCDLVDVVLPDSEANRLQIFVLDFPESKGFIQEEYISMEESLCGFVFRSGKAWTGGVSDVLKLGLKAAPVIPEGLKAGCILPLVRRNRVLGLLGLGRREKDAFSQADMEFLAQVANQIAIAVENALEYGQITEAKERLAEQKLYLEDEIRVEQNFEEIVGNSPRLKAVIGSVRIVAPADSTVLIQGETGTGKEMIARAIHKLGPRKDQAFVKVNCAAIPLGLLESELFGHERGAFTGAIAQKVGRFELAHKGTLFLDEVGDIPLELQPKLLRVLQEQEFERLGSTRTQRVDVRVLAATNVSLTQMVAEKKFRSDLYYRLNVFPIDVPPLRDRREDIPLLVHYFANKYARRLGKQIESIPKEAMDALSRYAWPGNIRELQNLMERAALLSTGLSLRVPLAEILTDTGFSPNTGGNSLEQAERAQILRALRESNWVVGGAHGAAARLGLKRQSLAYKMRKLGISRPAQ
jgi:formate hydrogenlyase transcriptional activator